MRQTGLTYGRITSAIIFGLFIAVHAICFAQKSHPLSIRALNAKNGKPIKGVSVGVSITYGKEYSDAVTNRDGIAAFDLHEYPERIYLDHSPLELRNCSELIGFPTDQILKTGLIAKSSCGNANSKWPVTPKPGELVIFFERVTFWDQVRKEIP